MTIENTIQGIRISTIKSNRLVSMHYIGYTRKKAIVAFKAYLKTLKD